MCIIALLALKEWILLCSVGMEGPTKQEKTTLRQDTTGSEVKYFTYWFFFLLISLSQYVIKTVINSSNIVASIYQLMTQY